MDARALMALQDRSAHMLAQLDGRLLLAEAGELVTVANVVACRP